MEGNHAACMGFCGDGNGMHEGYRCAVMVVRVFLGSSDGEKLS